MADVNVRNEGSSAALIWGIVAFVLLALLVWFLFLGGGGPTQARDGDVNVEVTTPQVDVPSPGQGGGNPGN
jgi:hypothetical protein